MDLVQEMLKYSDLLHKKAFQLSGNEADADDLVQETYLSALIAINKGADIQYVKPYLLGVMKKKHVDFYRRQYAEKNLNDISLSVDNSESYITNMGSKADVATAIRRELAYLPKMYREVMVQYYIERKSLEEIAVNLNISCSAVKTRLDRGRDKVKERVIKMEPFAMNSFNPDHLKLFIDGKYGLNNEPENIINSLIDQNVLIMAYEKPISVKAISEQLGIPMVFAEESVDKMVKSELMKSVGSKVFTNFPIIDDNFMLKIKNVQKEYVDDTFDEAKLVFQGFVDECRKQGLLTKYNDYQIYLYTLTTISSGVIYKLIDVLKLLKTTEYPDRPNTGKWIINFGYKRNSIDKEIIKSHHFLHSRFVTNDNYEVLLELRETSLSVSSWCTSNNMNSFDVAELLYYISKDEKYDRLRLYLIPDLIKLGFLYRCDDDNVKSNIPIISHIEHEKITEIINKYVQMYMDVLGDKLLDMVRNNTIKYPRQISPVSFKPQLISVHGITLAYVQKAADAGIIEIEEDTNFPLGLIIEKKV